MNFRLFYHNPISGKLNFLYTHCVHCGKRVSLNRKNLGQNRFGDTFYYCNDCKIPKEQNDKKEPQKREGMQNKLEDVYEAIFTAINDVKKRFNIPNLSISIIQKDNKNKRIKKVSDGIYLEDLEKRFREECKQQLITKWCG